MATLEQSRGTKHMRWIARILGLVYGIYIVLAGLAPLPGFWGHYLPGALFGVVFFTYLLPCSVLLLGLLLIMMVAVAWKWSGKWPEVLSGGVFIMWGLPPFVWACISLLFEPFGLSAIPVTLAWICPPLITGILFILAYVRSAKG
jgi:hypothetical protein